MQEVIIDLEDIKRRLTTLENQLTQNHAEAMKMAACNVEDVLQRLGALEAKWGSSGASDPTTF